VSESKKLGRSIEALMVEGAQAEAPRELDEHVSQMLSTNLIFPNEVQPRTQFDPEKMRQLVASIKDNGLLEPIIARPVEEGFEIVVGERRWRAAMELGLDTIPAIIRDVPDEKMLELALIENIHREDLNPMERAEAYAGFIKQSQLTQEQAAVRLQVDRAVLANTIRLLSLPQEVQDLVRAGSLPASHARALAGLGSPERQVRLARKCVAEGLSARGLESLLKKTKSGGGSRTSVSGKALPPELRNLEDMLRRHIGTRVTLCPGRSRRGGGKIVVDYYSMDELGRIVERMGLQPES